MTNVDNKDDSLFYCNIDMNSKNQHLIDTLREYSVEQSKQVYIIDKVLGTKNDYSYDLSNIAIVLIPKHPITIVNYGDKNEEALEDFLYDLKEDLGHISDKYEYYKILKRTRKWPKELFETYHIDDFNVEQFIDKSISKDYVRKIDLLISLLIGSINSVDKIGIDEPSTLLDKVKKKIILFDGKQSNFIYSEPQKKRIVIQGLAGTGKTELLLNKLKDIYEKHENSVIAFTCYNKVLAREMKEKRIPQFFNFMKVSEQIEWDKRLHVFPSWGSRNQPETGMFSYICCYYGLAFSTYNECPDFEKICEDTLSELEKLENFKPCFDYILIDESQDFGENFFALCEKVCKQNIYIAGDIFQNIFDSSRSSTDITIDYLLNKCYRTDPKTLMFAHSVGMGLYEETKINWLEEVGWNNCGYTFKRENNKIKLSRKPLRRFEDLETTDTIQLLCCTEDDMVSKTIDCIEIIVNNNDNVEPDDIAVIILGSNYNNMCSLVNEIDFHVYEKFGWFSTKGYISKTTEKGKIYLSNINNVKGLEFPFIICVAPNLISRNIFFRNSVYTSLTRSFLTSFFIVNSKNQNFLNVYQSALMDISTKGYIEVTEPTDREKYDITTNIKAALENRKMNIEEIVDKVLSEYPDSDKYRKNAIEVIVPLTKQNLSDDEIEEKLRITCSDVWGL